MEEPYQPRLSVWGHAWRLGVVLLLGLVNVATNAARWSTALVALDLGLGLASLVLAFWRRRWPTRVALLTALACTVSSSAGPVASCALVSLATRRRWREILPVGLAYVAASVWWYRSEASPAAGPWWVFWLVAAFIVIVAVALVAWGMYIGSRRELLWTLRQRAERAEAEQALRVAQARETERRRIAREMHDVLAHRISQISMHAGALAYRSDLGADALRSDLGDIRDRAHEALEDMRGVLGVLRGGADGAELLPQPTYVDLAALLERARAGGMRINLRDTLSAAPPESAGRTVYRIVQEGITNAGKHAPGATLDIALSGAAADGLSVELRNALGFDSGTPGSGIGLIGLAERAELAGGSLTHRMESGAFTLRAWIPWSA